MNDGWMLWLLLVGLAVGFVAAWLLLVRLPRDEEDVDAAERREEAAWISDTIERYGGLAPLSLVEEVLELHQVYLRDPRFPEDPYVGQDAAEPSSTPPQDPREPPPQPRVPALAPPRQPQQHPQPPPAQQATPHSPPGGAPDRSSTLR